MSLVTLADTGVELTSGVPRDGWTRPLVVPKRGGKPFPHTRSSSFSEVIEDKSALTDWKLREVLLGVSKHRDLLDEVEGLDVRQDKERLNEIAEMALNLAGAHDKANQGTLLHSFTELVDAGRPLPDTSSLEDRLDIATYLAETVNLRMLRAEGFVVCSQLAAAGSFDRVAAYEGLDPLSNPVAGNFIGDLKTGGIEYGQLKFSVQMALYAHGELYDHSLFPIPGYDEAQTDAQRRKAIAAWKKVEVPARYARKAYTPLPDVSKEWGILIHLPAGQATCDLYWVDLVKGWKLAKLAQKIREARRVKDTFTPFAKESSDESLTRSA